MTGLPQYSVAVRRFANSKPFGNDLVGQIGVKVCEIVAAPIIGFRLSDDQDVPQKHQISDVSRLVYEFVAMVGEEKARLAFAEYGLTLLSEDEGSAT